MVVPVKREAADDLAGSRERPVTLDQDDDIQTPAGTETPPNVRPPEHIKAFAQVLRYIRIASRDEWAQRYLDGDLPNALKALLCDIDAVADSKITIWRAMIKQRELTTDMVRGEVASSIELPTLGSLLCDVYDVNLTADSEYDSLVDGYHSAPMTEKALYHLFSLVRSEDMRYRVMGIIRATDDNYNPLGRTHLDLNGRGNDAGLFKVVQHLEGFVCIITHLKPNARDRWTHAFFEGTLQEDIQRVLRSCVEEQMDGCSVHSLVEKSIQRLLRDRPADSGTEVDLPNSRSMLDSICAFGGLACSRDNRRKDRDEETLYSDYFRGLHQQPESSCVQAVRLFSLVTDHRLKKTIMRLLNHIVKERVDMINL